MAELAQLLSRKKVFFTASSCAGHIFLLDGNINDFEVQKQNCFWLLVTHQPSVKDDLIVALKKKANRADVLTFEPLVAEMRRFCI